MQPSGSTSRRLCAALAQLVAEEAAVVLPSLRATLAATTLRDQAIASWKVMFPIAT